MSAAFDPLVQAVALEARVFEELVRASRAERDHLISGDVPALTAVLGEQKALIEELARAEEERDRALDGWRDAGTADDGTPPGPRPALRDVIAMAPPDVAHRLAALRERLVATAEELRGLARNNYFLALKGLQFVDATVKIVADHAGGPQSTYSGPGRAKSAGSRSMIVDRTA